MSFDAIAFLERLIRDDEVAEAELPESVNDWPEVWREEYEERAALMDKRFYGDLEPAEAEAWAESIVRAFYQQHHGNNSQNH